MRFFYAHLIEIDQVIVELNTLELLESERYHLAFLLDSTIFHTVLDMVLSKLPAEERRVFWERFHQNPEDETLLDFLTFRVERIEDEMREVIRDLVAEFYRDIKEVKENV